jgi:hypothetical protein
MNMKRIALFALLFVAVAAAAQALDWPACEVYYRCHYSNYMGPAVQDGLSLFTSCQPQGTGLSSQLHAIEKFQSRFNGQVIWDNRKVTFAKPAGVVGPNPTPPPVHILVGTQWEFTVNPNGPQCKDTVVYKEDGTIEFNNCTDGSSRTCTP